MERKRVLLIAGGGTLGAHGSPGSLKARVVAHVIDVVQLRANRTGTLCGSGSLGQVSGGCGRPIPALKAAAGSSAQGPGGDFQVGVHSGIAPGSGGTAPPAGRGGGHVGILFGGGCALPR